MEKWIVIKDENYLEHHGIKGQKWGVRKQNSENDDEKKTSEKTSTDIIDTKELKNKDDTKKSKVSKAILVGALATMGAALVTTLIVKLSKRNNNNSSKTSTKKTKRAKSAHIPGSSYKDVYGKGWNNDPYVKKGETIVNAYSGINLIASRALKRG